MVQEWWAKNQFGGGTVWFRKRLFQGRMKPSPDSWVLAFMGSKHSETPPDGLQRAADNQHRPRNVPSATESEIPKTIAQDSCAALQNGGAKLVGYNLCGAAALL